MKNKNRNTNFLGAYGLSACSTPFARAQKHAKKGVPHTLHSFLSAFVAPAKGALPLQSLARLSQAVGIGKIVILSLFLTFSLIFGAFQPINAQNTLESYLQAAEKNNPQIQAANSAYQAALTRISPAKALPDPIFSAVWFLQPIETKLGPQIAKFSLSQSMPWFGQLKAQGNAYSAYAEAVYENYWQTKTDIFAQIEQDYYRLYFKNSQIGLTKQILDYLKVLDQIVDSKLSVGKATAVDKLRLTMEIATVEDNIRYLGDQKRVLQTTILNKINDTTLAQIQVVGSLSFDSIQISKDSLFSSVLRQNHRLKALQHRIEAINQQLIVAQKKSYPKINLGVDYTIVGIGANTITNAGLDAIVFPKVGLSIPINRKKYKDLVKEKEWQAKEVEQSQSNLSLQLNTALDNVYKNIQDAENKYKLALYQVDLSKKSLDLLKASYMGSDANFEEILRMERKYLAYQIQKEKALSQLEVSKSILKQLIGLGN